MKDILLRKILADMKVINLTHNDVLYPNVIKDRMAENRLNHLFQLVNGLMDHLGLETVDEIATLNIQKKKKS